MKHKKQGHAPSDGRSLCQTNVQAEAIYCSVCACVCVCLWPLEAHHRLKR